MPATPLPTEIQEYIGVWPGLWSQTEPQETFIIPTIAINGNPTFIKDNTMLLIPLQISEIVP